MKKLLDIPREGGYPLCAETLGLLHDNVQLLETALNGLKLPQHTIVRFPYGDFAYVQSVNPTSGTGEILKISQGGNLSNANVHSYVITRTQQNVTDANNEMYADVFENATVTLSASVSQTQSVKVYNFNEVLEPAMFNVYGYYGVFYNNQNAYQYISSVGSYYFKENGDIAKIRINLNVSNLPNADEILCLFNITSFQIGLRGIKAMIYDSDHNRAVVVDAFVRTNNNRLAIVINAKDYYDKTGHYLSNGYIEINEVITL